MGGLRGGAMGIITPGGIGGIGRIPGWPIPGCMTGNAALGGRIIPGEPAVWGPAIGNIPPGGALVGYTALTGTGAAENTPAPPGPG
jgi:hypothetical protein